MKFFADIRKIYRESRKIKDIFWNRGVCRPCAAVLVRVLAATSVTPNQVTFLSYGVFVLAAVAAVLLPGHLGLVAAVLILQGSYILDCADGMLARYRGTASPIGHLLDFLMDELKAGLFLAAVAVRLYLAADDVRYLLLGLLGVVVVNSGISLTTFIRRPQFPGANPDVDKGARDAAGQDAAPRRPKSIVGLAVATVEGMAKFVIHYPSYVLILAIINRIDIYLYAYIVVNILYFARTFLAIVLKLGRFGSAAKGVVSSEANQ